MEAKIIMLKGEKGEPGGSTWAIFRAHYQVK